MGKMGGLWVWEEKGEVCGLERSECYFCEFWKSFRRFLERFSFFEVVGDLEESFCGFVE